MGARTGDMRLPVELVDLAKSQRDRVPKLAEQVAVLLAEKVECYRRVAEEAPDELRKVCEVHLDRALTSFIEGNDAALRAAALKTGRVQARAGIALEDALRAYRIAGTFCYEMLVEPVLPPGGSAPEQLLLASSAVWRIVDSYSEALATAFREVAEKNTLELGQARDDLFDGLVQGRITRRVELDAAAHALGLPAAGTYLVLVADRLPNTLVTSGMFRSTWRRGVDTHIGIVALDQADARGAVDQTSLVVLRQLLGSADTTVGLSTPVTDLLAVPAALERARIARRCLPPGASGVVAFGDLPVAALVAAAPELAVDVARGVLGPVLALPKGERDVLLETLEAWYLDGGSAKAAGQRLYVHPNTVRYRLRRVEDLTGRDLAHPRRSAELYVALQAVRLGPGEQADAVVPKQAGQRQLS